MDKKDVLKALNRVELKPGLSALGSGHIQDVLFEPFDGGTYVALVIDPLWEGQAPPLEALGAIEATLAKLDGVTKVKIIPRQRPAVNVRPRQAPPEGFPKGSKVLAVASGKGGVGKSTVSVNLAVALRRAGIRTAIIDCDMYGFSVPQLIGLEEPPEVEEGTKRVKPPRAKGVPVMSLEFFVKGNDPVVWRGPMLGKALRQFVSLSVWTDEEIYVLDLPPGTGDVLMDVHDFFATSSILVVTTPDPFAARVAERAGTMARKTGHPLVGVVENMAFLPCPDCGAEVRPWGKGGADAVAHDLGTDVIARLPLVPSTALRQDALAPEGSDLERLYDDLAVKVIDRVLIHPVAAEAQEAFDPS